MEYDFCFYIDHVKKINEQHDSLKRLIEKINNNDLFVFQMNLTAYNSLKPLVKKLEEILLDFFDWQKIKFFEDLKGLSKSSENHKDIDFLETQSKEAKIASLEFIDKHPCGMGDLNARHFYADFSAFSNLLIRYIENQRKYLLPILKELIL